MLNKDNEGRYIIPEDYKGDVTMLKSGYPEGSEFIKASDIVEEAKVEDNGKANKAEESEVAAALLNQEKKEEAKKDEFPPAAEDIFKDPEFQQLGITDKGKLIEHMVQMRSELHTATERANLNPFAQYDFDEQSIKELMLSKESDDLYKSYMKVKHGNIRDVDLLITKAMSDNPDVFETEELARSYIEDQFGLQPLRDIPEDADEDEIEEIEKENAKIKKKNDVVNAKIKLEAKKARQDILGAVDKYELPKRKTKEDIEKETTEYVSKWQPVFKEKIAAEKEIEFANGFKFKLDEKATQVYLQAAAQYISMHRPELSEEGMKTVKDYASNIVMIEFKDDIFLFSNKMAREMAEKEWEEYIAKKYFNPSGMKEEAKVNVSTKSSGVDKYMSDIENRRK